MEVSTVRSSRTVTVLLVTWCSAWPASSITFAWSVAGKV
jgi:hypothetical protein